MISGRDISIQFGEQALFSGVTFHLGERDRIGLVGANGSGKSTLLKVIAGELTPDQGTVEIPGGVKTGYLPQNLTVRDRTTIYEEAASALQELIRLKEEIGRVAVQLSQPGDLDEAATIKLADNLAHLNERFEILGGYQLEKEIGMTLKGLGFAEEDFDRPTSELSGGWRMRVELAKILLQKPPVLLLDEPTNHLDIESIQWLEEYFKSYRGSILLVSHDRALLDHVTNRTWELELNRLTDYPFSYSKAMVVKEERYEQQLAAWKNRQKKIEETEAFIERFRYKASKAVQVQSRIRQLEKMEPLPEPTRHKTRIKIRLGDVKRSGDIVLQAKNVSRRFGPRVVLDGIDLEIRRGEKIALVGKNGEGKTTLARILAGDLDGDGEVRTGANVFTGYYAQNQGEFLAPDMTVFETAEAAASPEVRPRIRTLLGAFLFRGEEIDKKVKVLSGGEKSRLALLVMLFQPLNFLILDEPTHHLDMTTKAVLKEALNGFQGTLLLVSHDRDFLDGLVDKYYLVRDKKIREYSGNIYTLLAELNATGVTNKSPMSASANPNKQENKGRSAYLKRKEQKKAEDKIRREILRIEAEIASLEREKEEMHRRMELFPAGEERMDNKVYEDYDRVSKRLDEVIENWERACKKLENLEK